MSSFGSFLFRAPSATMTLPKQHESSPGRRPAWTAVCRWMIRKAKSEIKSSQINFKPNCDCLSASVDLIRVIRYWSLQHRTAWSIFSKSGSPPINSFSFLSRKKSLTSWHKTVIDCRSKSWRIVSLSYWLLRIRFLILSMVPSSSVSGVFT